MRDGRWHGWASFLLLALGLAACTRTSPEQALRGQMDALQNAIEAREWGGIDEILAGDFVGNGGMDKQEARRVAAALFMRYRNVGVSIGPLRLQMHGDDGATVDFTAVATGGDGALPESGRIWDVTTGWRLDGNDWQLVSAEWKPKL